MPVLLLVGFFKSNLTLVEFNVLQIEHAQHLATGAPARFGQLEVIASVQVD